MTRRRQLQPGGRRPLGSEEGAEDGGLVGVRRAVEAGVPFRIFPVRVHAPRHARPPQRLGALHGIVVRGLPEAHEGPE